MLSDVFFLQKDNLYAVPITHYNMEMAIEVRKAFLAINPDCVAVELAETMELQILHAASRLPDLSVIVAENGSDSPTYLLVEPCDASFEALRLAQEKGISAHCIDLDEPNYPDVHEPLPDSYATSRIGLKAYYEIYQKVRKPQVKQDVNRELYMAKRLKELCLRYDKVLFVGGMAHIESILNALDNNSFPVMKTISKPNVTLATLTEDSAREVMVEMGWIARHFEDSREDLNSPDRQQLIFSLCKAASNAYHEATGNTFASYHLRNMLKFTRNWALITGKLLPDLFQILTAARGCVDSNYAYEVWKLGTEYPFLKNVDNLPALDLSAEDIWGHSKRIRFHLKQQNPKALQFQRRKKDRTPFKFEPPGPFFICSWPPEDIAIENFGEFLKKKGTQLLSEEAARSLPFTTSLEDGIDARETLRHFAEKKVWVKAKGKPPGGVGTVVVIFDEDMNEEKADFVEKYPWKTTWMGEHNQESDMSFFATDKATNVVGPGISRCEYGGFLMSYPPRRLMDVWTDPDYFNLKSKAEVLLAAAIDYSLKPVIVYVASKPPRTLLKSHAKKYGKKVVYIPIGQLSPVTLNKLRAFHVLDGHGKRGIAGEYIF